jgi:mRNA interferase RelE/StbE
VTYRVEVAPAAERQLRRLDAKNRTRIAERVRSLGDSRVVYQIQTEQLIVLVLRIGHRREIYRKLERLRGP